jgi:hypothetical protein
MPTSALAIAHLRSPRAAKLFDEELAALVDRGFTPVLALRAIAAVVHYTIGFVLQEQARQQAAATGDQTPDSDEIPTLVAAMAAGARTLTRCSSRACSSSSTASRPGWVEATTHTSRCCMIHRRRSADRGRYGIVIDKHVTVTMRDAPSCRPTSTAPIPVARTPRASRSRGDACFAASR